MIIKKNSCHKLPYTLHCTEDEMKIMRKMWGKNPPASVAYDTYQAMGTAISAPEFDKNVPLGYDGVLPTKKAVELYLEDQPF